MKASIDALWVLMLCSGFFAWLGWFDYTGRTPPKHGGNKTSGKGFLLASFFMLISALAFLVGFEGITFWTSITGMFFFVISGMLRSPQYRKPNE